MVVKGVLNTVVHLLKVALGKKKKSIARKRSNLAGEFPERVTGEVISAFSGVLMSSGELWELNNSLLSAARRATAEHTCDRCTALTPVTHESTMMGLVHIIKVLLNHLVSQWIDKKMIQKIEESTVFIFHSAVSFS